MTYLDLWQLGLEEASRHGLEIALDFAIQCSPDHPWVREHPDWFHVRPDGSIQYAQNPPKQYQDIYPLDFDTPDIEGLKAELKRVVDHWIAHGIRTFRVDNPHTKAIPFWEWLIDAVHVEHPDVLFLAEAFTRPKMMQTLGKVGFSMSYTYFAWRNTKYELTEYLTELSRTDMVDYYRPHFWPNTPDILTEFLQTGGPAAFKIRLLLAATMSPGYGIYSGYELYEHVAVREGSEEYLDSEKYAYRPRDWSRPDSLAPWIGTLNRIRSEHPSLRTLRSIWFHQTDSNDILAYSKVAEGRTDPILVVVNLNPHETRATMTYLDLWQLGLEEAGPFEAHDLLTGRTFIWHGPTNYVELNPSAEPAHVLSLRAL
jgi:starch synthase (maltosyl-transferring)